MALEGWGRCPGAVLGWYTHGTTPVLLGEQEQLHGLAEDPALAPAAHGSAGGSLPSTWPHVLLPTTDPSISPRALPRTGPEMSSTGPL